jgi:hypothetical protein
MIFLNFHYKFSTLLVTVFCWPFDVTDNTRVPFSQLLWTLFRHGSLCFGILLVYRDDFISHRCSWRSWFFLSVKVPNIAIWQIKLVFSNDPVVQLWDLFVWYIHRYYMPYFLNLGYHVDFIFSLFVENICTYSLCLLRIFVQVHCWFLTNERFFIPSTKQVCTNNCVRHHGGSQDRVLQDMSISWRYIFVTDKKVSHAHLMFVFVISIWCQISLCNFFLFLHAA